MVSSILAEPSTYVCPLGIVSVTTAPAPTLVRLLFTVIFHVIIPVEASYPSPSFLIILVGTPTPISPNVPLATPSPVNVALFVYVGDVLLL